MHPVNTFLRSGSSLSPFRTAATTFTPTSTNSVPSTVQPMGFCLSLRVRIVRRVVATMLATAKTPLITVSQSRLNHTPRSALCNLLCMNRSGIGTRMRSLPAYAHGSHGGHATTPLAGPLPQRPYYSGPLVSLSRRSPPCEDVHHPNESSPCPAATV